MAYGCSQDADSLAGELKLSHKYLIQEQGLLGYNWKQACMSGIPMVLGAGKEHRRRESDAKW